MLNYLLIFTGCGFGGVLRYLVSSKFSNINNSFPYGTLIVNVTGSFLAGLIFMLIIKTYSEQQYLSDNLKPLLITGFLGGYTTFSAFSIETLNLINSGKLMHALINIVLSVVLGITFAFLGVCLAKNF